MKIVLIQPKAYKHAPAHVSEPINLGYLAAYLRKMGYAGVNIRMSAFDSEEDIVADASRADIVGITATSPMMTDGCKIAENIKKNNRNSIIVFGGTHPSALPESTLKVKNIDIVVRGEGEITFHELVVAIEKKLPLKMVNGISYRENGSIVHNIDRSLIEEINSIPFPTRDTTYHMIPIYKKNCDGKRCANIFSSRGCPYNCTYCASKITWQQRCRMRSAENVVAEIEELKSAYRIQHIIFQDDTFTIDAARVFRFCDLLMKKKTGITWECNVHVNTVCKDLFIKMKLAGCVRVWVGVESGSALILNELRKHITPTKIRSVFRWARDAGLKRHAYLMIGSHNESLKTIQETEKLVKEIGPDTLNVAIFTPYPGCEAYQHARHMGFVYDDMDWSEIDLHFSVVMPTKFLTKKDVANEQSRLNKIFDRYMRREKINFSFLMRIFMRLLRDLLVIDYLSLPRKLRQYLRIMQ